MVSTEKLLSYPYYKLPFTVHIDASDKQLGAIMIHNNKPIVFFSRIFIKPQRNYTITEKELLAIVECLNQFRRIISGYGINVFSYYKNLVYAKNLSEYQRLMHWGLIIEYFGTNIHHIYGVDNIVDYTLSILPSMPSDKYDSCTGKDQYCTNELFAIGRV